MSFTLRKHEEPRMQEAVAICSAKTGKNRREVIFQDDR
jgi:hypothetical protein